jgi:hypothetical protein
MTAVASLLLAASIDGGAALRHASALAALGGRGFGSPRNPVAAEYVAAQFRAAGLSEVSLQPFEARGHRGSNVIAVLRASGPAFAVIATHHDAAAGSPGAYDAGAGVGVVIEAARVLAASGAPPRTLVFASFDGQEPDPDAPGASGSRAYVASLGARARDLIGALDLEMCGWSVGRLVLHAPAYADPLRPGATVAAPGWLVAAAQRGAAAAGIALPVGDPLASLLYQPAMRAFRARPHGDDSAFLQAGLPAVRLSDSSLAYFYPHYHQPTDTPDKLDAAALERAGRAVLGIADVLARESRPAGLDAEWLAAGSVWLGGSALLALAAASLLPGLVAAARAGGAFRAARLGQAVLFGVLAWRWPVPASFAFLLPNLATPWLRRPWALALSLLPLLSLLAFGALGWARQSPQGRFVTGTWLASWELGAALLALALLFVAPSGAPRPGRKVRLKRAGRQR